MESVQKISHIYSQFTPERHKARNLSSQCCFSHVSDVAEEWNSLNNQGPVVRMQVSANPGLNFNPGSFIFLSKALFQVIFSFRFRVSNHQIVGKEN